MQRRLLLGAVLLGAGPFAGSQFGCVESVEVDDAERIDSLAASVPPVADFDPAQSVVPLPNALLMNPATGRLNVPASCGEEPGSSAERLRHALNQLDGFGTSRMNLVATFSAPVDLESTRGRVFLVRIAEGGMALQRFEGPVAMDVVAGSTQRFAADCGSSEVVPNLTLRPRAPLQGSSTYAVLLARGITTVDGQEVEPSPTWALVRQAEAPVQFSDPQPSALPDYNATPFDPANAEDLASLHGLDALWQAHAPLLAALDQLAPALEPDATGGRDDVLLAWAFGTQTIATPLDPAESGSAASQVSAAAGPLVLPGPLAGTGAPFSVAAFFASAVPQAPCAALGCDAIGAVYAASPLTEAPHFTASSFLQGDDCSAPGAAAAGFDDPVHPKKVCERQLPVLLVLPATVPPATVPAAGFPTVIFGHGITRSKEDLLALAGALARGGIASVALDAVDHGVRAVQVSTDPALGCAGAGPGLPCTATFGPTCAPQCFAPILSPDLATSRDHLRQTVLDQLALEAALRGCAAPGACGSFLVDAQRIGYLGQSLGSLIGGVTAAVSGSMRTSVLNVGAADWVQILVDSDTAAIRCPLVDALITSGVLAGELWNGGANGNATCLGEAWKTDPGFLQFAAVARWVYDPIDPVNYASRYKTERDVLLAEVVGDRVIPNSATMTFGTALGLSPELAARATLDGLLPSPAVAVPGSHWLRYQGVDADLASFFPGNAYSHGSLLAPATASASMALGSGQLGTLRMQLDTVTYLATHLGAAP